MIPPVLAWDDPTAEHEDVLRALLFQQSHRFREERHVRAGQHRQPDDVDVFLHRGVDSQLWGPAQPGTEDSEPRYCAGGPV